MDGLPEPYRETMKLQAFENLDYEAIAARLDCPLLFNWSESGRTPPIPLARIESWGYKLVIYPITGLFAATHALNFVDGPILNIPAFGRKGFLAGRMPAGWRACLP